MRKGATIVSMHELLAFLASRASTSEDRHGEGPFPENTLRQLAEAAPIPPIHPPDGDDPEHVERESERDDSAGHDG